ncbi:Eco57I restriction-modification methylase domain-containing protein [Lysobacter sp. A286]
MTPASELASQEGFADEAGRRKRLGQYFSGTALGRVLAALAGVHKSHSVLDPMAGSGDLLAACAELGTSPAQMAAVEIDPLALRLCEGRLPDMFCALGSAFDPKIIGGLPRLQWDLVITNPPYVRYQSLSKASGKEFPLPDAVEVRNGLLSLIELLPSLDATDKELFGKLVQGYSGLADLAVPSWLLCAALVSPGGRLALVVPESWLSREYAAVVHYMLLRWFDIEFIVEDEHACWFADAQVKTTLLVARRVARKASAFDTVVGDSFARIAISGNASGPLGPCSRLRRDKVAPERAFASEARSWLATGAGHQDDMVKVQHIPLAKVAANLRGACAKQKWFAGMGETIVEAGPLVPHPLDQWLGRSCVAPRPHSLTSLGVGIGQGLRTGANAFFYAEAMGAHLVLERLFPGMKWKVPADLAAPAVRKQEDLPAGFLVGPNMPAGRVLDLRRNALPEDIRRGGAVAAKAFKPLPADLARLVRKVATVDFGDDHERKRIWQLSAVAPNERKGNAKTGVPPRYWYMLPEFARRHQPDVFMARINAGSPKAFLNQNAKCVVDANFATLWVEDGGVDKYALLALLNSAWTTATLELSASVMGGGALKIEAAHLRRLPVPLLTSEACEKLGALGRKLARVKSSKLVAEVLGEIDKVVAFAALGRRATASDIKALRELAVEGRARRQGHKKGVSG